MRRLSRRNLDRPLRTGMVAFELLLITPVFLVMLLGFVELSMIVLVEERLAAASNVGARVASQGGSTTDIKAAVDNYLGVGTPIQSSLQYKYDPVPFDPPSAYFSGTQLTVRLEVEACKVVPDLLRFVGFSLSGQILVGQTVVRKE